MRDALCEVSEKIREAEMLRIFVIVVIAISLSRSQYAFPETWVDEDGKAMVVIESPVVKIISTSSFTYFDKMFDNVRNEKEVRLCIGEDDTDEVASDCVLGVPRVEFQNKGNTRIIIFDTLYSKFMLQAVEHYLAEGKSIRVTVDDIDIFAAFIIHKDNMLTDKAKLILSEK